MHGDTRVLTLEDSVKAKPRIATTLLYGLGLPKDMDQLPIELVLNFREMCSYIVQVSPLVGLLFFDFSSSV